MKTLLTLMCLFTASLVSAQSIERQVVGSAGQVSDNPFASLSYTTGEPVTLSAVHQDAQLSQGFQQADEETTASLIDLKAMSASISVFPNPARDHLNITSNLPEKGIIMLSYAILDMEGRIVRSGSVHSGNGTIGLDDLSASGYILRLYSTGNRYDHRIRFMKM